MLFDAYSRAFFNLFLVSSISGGSVAPPAFPPMLASLRAVRFIEVTGLGYTIQMGKSMCIAGIPDLFALTKHRPRLRLSYA